MLMVLLTAVLPVFAVIALGYWLGRRQYLSTETTTGMVWFVVYLALPALLFLSLSRQPLDVSQSARVATSYAGATMLLYVFSVWLARRRLGMDAPQQCLFGMAATFSNSVMVGVPLVLSMFGKAALVPLTLIILFNTVVLLGGTTVLIEVRGAPNGSWWQSLRRAGRAVLSNPIIMAIAGGLSWGYGGLPTGAIVERFLDILAGAALPCGLAALGASMAHTTAQGSATESIGNALLKLVVHPLLVWVVAAKVFMLEERDLQLVVVVAGLPMAANVFILAKRYERFVNRAATGFILTTAASILTLSVIVSLVVP